MKCLDLQRKFMFVSPISWDGGQIKKNFDSEFNILRSTQMVCMPTLQSYNIFQELKPIPSSQPNDMGMGNMTYVQIWTFHSIPSNKSIFLEINPLPPSTEGR